MIDSLCIVGGGTSGLIAALILRKAWPELKITIIESSKIGIIGVGEGSTEHWRRFMDHANIDIFSLVKETGATFKIGIKFTDWNGDGKSYFHSLSDSYTGTSKVHGLPYIWLQMIGEDWNPLDTMWDQAAASMHPEPVHAILAQYHFDTNKLNTYLHKICKERKITVIDTEIKEVILDQQGYVKELLDVTDTKHTYEFYIDCSGFQRVIGSKLKAKWIDCSQQLPMNSAIAFPTDYTESIPSYTQATALSSGWVWRIPTQDRYGNGYVFCDSFVNETQAYDEVSQHYKNNLGIMNSLSIGKKIKFTPGYVENYWIKNCVMVGLSGIFVEPLEASSIGTTIQQVMILCPDLFFYEKGEELTAERYNKQMKGISENIVDFIQLHYFTKRNDSKFWQWCKNAIVPTAFNAKYLEYFKKGYPNINLFNDPMALFSYMNFGQVMHGLGMFDNSNIKKKFEAYMAAHAEDTRNMLKYTKAADLAGKFYTHREALEIIKQRAVSYEYKF